MGLHKWTGLDKVDYQEINENFDALDTVQKENLDKFEGIEQKSFEDMQAVNLRIANAEGENELLANRQDAVEEKQDNLDQFIKDSGINGHSHNNEVVLRGFDEIDGYLYYNGERVKTSTGIEIVKWTNIMQKPTFSDVALSGDYEDLINKPNVPVRISQLENDSKFVSEYNVPTKTSQLVNDSDFITGLEAKSKILPSPVNMPTLTGSDGFVVAYDAVSNSFILKKR